MAPKSKFLLKDSPAEVIQAADSEPKGRAYDAAYSQRPGGIKVDELVLGMKLASVAITDDKPDTLKNVAKSNPWQKEAMKMITGSKTAAYETLSEILEKHFGLTMDHHIDISGIHHGRALDTQGYIAHNDEMIVLSYRCTTSALDWITNLSTTTSEWEPDVDIDLGHAGFCSCLMGHELCGFGNGGNEAKPRVHTGFYNNFLATTPMIMEHIAPLLTESEKPRKLFVVGHSLGAGVATMAACYFLLNFEWELLPQQLVCVTAGSPRAVQRSMQEIVHARLKELKPMGKASFNRIVLNEDVVTKVPPAFLGFVHLDNLIYITEEGEVLVRPDENNRVSVNAEQAKDMCNEDPYAGVMGDGQEKSPVNDDDDDDDESQDSSPLGQPNEKYERKLKMVPRALKDHMPDFYLKPLVRLFEREKNGMSVVGLNTKASI